jgi:DNA polymerase elongation subunit (family B)
MNGIPALQKSIDIGLQAEHLIQRYLKPPHVLEYEKTFWPFILFTKKRYVGNLYETDVNEYKQKSMGIVLKRRDNAPIVKYVYGGIIDCILNKKSLELSIDFLKESLMDLITNKFDVQMLVISKTLRASYKDPESIAHKVLADRMGERDPGNKPQSNDRIPYCFIDKYFKIKYGVDLNI